MSRITSSPAAVFVAGVVLALALVGGVVAGGILGAGFGTESGEAATKPLKTAYARVLFDDNADGKYFEKSRGVLDVQAIGNDTNRVYCFNLAFPAKVAAGSPFINNNATIAVWLPGQSLKPAVCDEAHSDAAAKTIAANQSVTFDDINFNIIFHG